MTKLGKCIDISGLEPNILLDGGATSTWENVSDAHGRWTVHHPAGSSCEGDPETLRAPFAQCSLLMKGCGKVKVHASGSSGDVLGVPYAAAYLTLKEGAISSQENILLVGGNGGESCSSQPLAGVEEATMNIGCGCTLTLIFDGSATERNPACDCVFDVEVLI